MVELKRRVAQHRFVRFKFILQATIWNLNG